MHVSEERSLEQPPADTLTTADGCSWTAVGSDVPSVSIVVPTHNRAELLKALLDTIDRLEWDVSRLEVFVVGDTLIRDDTESVVASYARTAAFPVDYLTAPNSPAAKRNAGIRASRSELIAFTD